MTDSAQTLNEDYESDGRAEAGRARIPAPGSVYAAWGGTLVVALAAVVVMVALSTDEANWVKWLSGALLVGVVAASFVLAYSVEKRRRFIYRCRSEAIDLAFAIETGLTDVIAEWAHDRPGTDKSEVRDELWNRALDEVRELESWLVNSGAYGDAAVVSDVRRRAEAALASRGKNRYEQSEEA